MFTRRDFLRIGTTGVLASGLPAFADDPIKPGSYLLISCQHSKIDATDRHGYLVVDAETGACFLVEFPYITGYYGRISPDRKLLAVSHGGSIAQKLFIRDPQTGAEIRALGNFMGEPMRAPDGCSLIVTSAARVPGKPLRETCRLRADGSGNDKLPFAEHEVIHDWSMDGEWLVSTVTNTDVKKEDGKPLWTTRVVHPDASGGRILFNDEAGEQSWAHRFSPDGRTIVYRRLSKDECSLWMINVATKERRKFLPEIDRRAPGKACWSPDGKNLAVLYGNRTKSPTGSTVFFGSKIDILSSDGKTSHHLELPSLDAVDLLCWA